MNRQLVALLWFTCTADAAQVDPSTIPSTTALSRFESRLERLRVKYDIPGMSAVIVQSNAVVWSKGFGYADLEVRHPTTPDTVYHLASLTKPFAAVVLLQLVQEGKLNLDAPASDFGINLKSDGVIRVRHLLTHTSEGIPGTVYRYSGNRFGELDKVLTKTTGKSFAQLVSERILEPLQLTNTSPNPRLPQSAAEAHRDPAEFTRRLARGYHPDGIKPLEFPYPMHFATAAGLVSTVGDMARFSMALDEDRLLRKETKELAFSPALSSDGKRMPYGLGWFVQERKGVKLVWHYGWWIGNSSLIIKVPERGLTFVMLANSDGLSREFDLGKDENVLRSPFAKEFVSAFVEAKK